MPEEPQNSETFIKEIFKKSKTVEPQKDEKRVSKIISQARRDTGARDFITLVFVRIWVVLAEITCKAFARQSLSKNINPNNIKVEPNEKVNPKE